MFKKNSLNALLILLYLLGIIIFLQYELLIKIVIFMWLPVYYNFKYWNILEIDGVKVFSVPTNIREFEEGFIMLLFYIPFIGPIIAILRINYLQNEIEKREKMKK